MSEIALERALRAAENYKRGWLEKISELESERVSAVSSSTQVAAVMSLLDRTCCQLDETSRTCRTELEHKRDWCMHCRVSAAIEGES